jgi:hypothetical protein
MASGVVKGIKTKGIFVVSAGFVVFASLAQVMPLLQNSVAFSMFIFSIAGCFFCGSLRSLSSYSFCSVHCSLSSIRY